MADVVDDFGRVTRLKADFESLSESLRSAVGKAVEYAAGRAKENTDDLKVEFEKLVDAMEELGDNVKESLKSTRDFVEEVKKVAESVEKARAARSEVGRDKLADAQREQTRILHMLLKSHQKAVSDKAAKFTSGSTVLSAPVKRKADLKEMGFRPRGADKIPAMVSPGEFVVSKKGTMGNEGLLNRINRGYMRGGKVKPEYLSAGSSGSAGSPKINIYDSDSGRIPTVVVQGHLDDESKRKINDDFARLGYKVAFDFNQNFNDRMRLSASTWFASIATALTGGGDPWQIMFEGAVKDVTEFRREMRNLAFQTEGITGSFREAQEEFSRIGTDIASRTGVSVTAFQKAYLNNARKGFKDQKAGMKVLESGLKLSTLIGSESQATATLFADWHRELGMGAVQMERMANNMQMVARSTGVTGDELVEVMGASKEILKNLRNQGTLTTTAARNITQAMAEFKKQGFGEEGQRMLSAMSGYGAFQGADDSTKRILSIASQEGGVDYRDLMFGDVVQDGDKMGQMAKGLNDFMANAIGVDPKKFNIDLITDEQRRSLSIALEGMGISLGAAESAINTFQKSAQGLGGQLSEFEKVTKSATSTEKEKQEAEKKMNDMLLSSSMDMLGSVTQVAEKFGDKSLAEISGILGEDNKFAKDFATGNKDLASMASYFSDSLKSGFGLSGTAEQMAQQIKSMDIGKQIELRSMAAAEQMDKMMVAAGKGNKDFASRMQNALAKGDRKLFKSISDEMVAAQSELQVGDATNVDPMEKLEQTMNELNETIRSYLSPLTGGIIDLVGWMGILGAQFGAMGSTLYNLFGGNFVGNLMSGGLGGVFEEFALDMAKSDKIKDGMFKKFFQTYSESRRTNPFAKMSGTMGEKSIGGNKSVLSSLDDAVSGLRDDMLGGLTKMGGSVVDFFENAGKSSTRFFNAFVTGFKRGWKSSGNFFEAMTRGFGGAIKSSSATREILMKMGGVLKNVNVRYAQAIESLMKTSPALAKFTHHSAMLGKAFTMLKFGEIFKHFGKAMNSGFQVFRNALNPASWKALFSMGLKGMKGAILTGSAGTAQLIFSAIDMVFGAVSGFMNTGKRFEGVMKAMGKATKDMTWGMYASSTVAGALVGILDGLTFGLFRMSGAAEFLEQTLSYVLYTVFSFVEGIVEGILYPFRMVWSAVKHIGVQLKGIGDSILGVFNAIAGIFGAEAGNWSEAFAMVYPWLKAVGSVIGYVVGMPLAGFLWLVVKGISAALVPLQMLFAAVTGVIRVLSGFVKFFKDIFRVGLWQATKNLAWTVFDAVMGIFRPVTDFLWSLMGDILAPFQWLANILCWNSIVPDMVVEIVRWFAMLPVRIFGFLVKIPVMLGKALLKIPSVIGDMYSKVGSYFQSFGNDNIFAAVLSQLGNLYSFIGGTIKNLVGIASGILSVVQGVFTLDFGVIWDGLSQIGSSIVAQISNAGSFFYKTLKNAGLFLFKMLRRIPIMVLYGLKSVFFDFPKWLVGKLMDGVWTIGNFMFLTLPKMMWDGFKKAISSMGKYIWDTLTWPFRKIGELLKAVFYDFPIWLGTKITDGLKSVFYDLPMWLGSVIASGMKSIFYDLPVWLGKTIWDGMGKVVSGIPGAIYGALHGAASAIGLGWLVERIAGGGKKGGSSSKNEASASTASGVVGGLSAVVAGLYAFKKAGPAVVGLAGRAFEGLKLAGPQVIAMASKAFGYLKDLVPNIGNYAGEAFGLIKKIIPSRLSKAAGGLISKVGGVLSPMDANPFASMGGTMGKQATKTRGIVGMITDSLGGAMKKGKDLVGGLRSKIPVSFDKGKGILGNLLGKSGDMASAGKNLIGKGTGIVGSLFGKAAGIGSKIMSTVSSGGGIVGSLFGKAGGFLAKAGIGGMGKSLLKKLPGIGAVAGAGFAVASLINGDLGGALTNLASGIAGAIPFIGPVLSAGIDMFGNSLTEGAGWIAGKAWEGAKSIGTKALEGAKWLGSKAWDGIKNMGSAAWEGIKNMGSAAWEGMKSFGSWLFGGENKEEKLAGVTVAKIEAQTVQLSTAVGQHAIPAARPDQGTPAAGVEPVHLRDITGTILRDKAGSGGNKLHSDELSRMEEASNRQVSELEQIRQGIQELVSLMKPKGGGLVGGSGDAGPGNTKDPRRPMHAARFGKMKFGVPGGMANRSVVNNGEV